MIENEKGGIQGKGGGGEEGGGGGDDVDDVDGVEKRGRKV